MILLTDRPKSTTSLVSTLGLAQQCAIVGVHQALSEQRIASVIICDASIDNIAASDVLRSAITSVKRREPSGVVFLARDPSQLTAAQAKALGANIILPPAATPNEILDAIRSIRHPAASNERNKGCDSVALGVSAAEAGSALRALFRNTGDGKPISVEALDQGSSVVVSTLRQHEIQNWLNVVWRFDDVTYQHCMLVAGIVAKFAAHIGLSLPNQHLMTRAALLHDVGKAQIPHRILNKPGALSPAEWQIMKAHPAIGYELLTKQGGFNPHILDVVRHHHEYLDGSGYPDGLTQEKLSPFVRMTTICDIFAALVERRPYKVRNSQEKALSVLHSMNAKLDEDLLDSFESMMKSSLDSAR